MALSYQKAVNAAGKSVDFTEEGRATLKPEFDRLSCSNCPHRLPMQCAGSYGRMRAAAFEPMIQ